MLVLRYDYLQQPGQIAAAGGRSRLCALLLMVPMIATCAAAGVAASEQRVLDLSIQPSADIRSEPGPIERALGTATGLHQEILAGERPELAIKAGGIGLALRREDNKLKPDVFYDVSGWRLRTRIMSGDSPLDIEGMLVRAAHAFPLFGDKPGTADLP
ncbi:MAG TPA: hypothetical protein VHL31_25430 [Geminicoccus sp.]|uniref:hypothetical protein n=1 Tax=Geminicoccus sp. TaxID=2024832 RepID=UPI002E366EBF|nr:hypothetical protein [Geminicoccus sp.]HEX2529618.1 hypothetical protein [Geminicoccus sp.]